MPIVFFSPVASIVSGKIFFFYVPQKVNGLIRVPLMNNDELKGLPMFLNHRFCGVAKTQLLHVLWKRNLLTEEEIQKSIELSKTI